MITKRLLTENDKKCNYDKLYQLMDIENVDGMFVSGDAALKFVNGEFASGWGVFALIPRHGDPVFFIGNEGREYILTPIKKNAADYWINDFTLMSIPNVVKQFREKDLEGKRVGFNLDSFPYGLFMALKSSLNFIEIVDISAPFKEIRMRKSAGYMNIIEEAIDIVDTCVKELPKLLHTGMYEYEVKALIESIMIGRGADGTLILINSDKNDISSPAIPTDHNPKPISKGDMMVVEITVNYRGCWLQKIADYSFGEPKKEFRFMFDAVNDAISESVKMVKPGTNAKDLVNAIDDYIESKGLLSARSNYVSGPCGHLSGYEMDEATFSPFRDFILQEGMMFVLHPAAALPGWTEGEIGMFGPGTMFYVTADGVKSLNKTTNEIYVIER